MNNSKSRVTDALVLLASLELAVLLASLVSLASLVPHPIFSDGNVNLKHNFFPQMKMGPFEHRVGEEE